MSKTNVWPMTGMTLREQRDWLLERYIKLRDENERLRASAVGAEVGAEPFAALLSEIRDGLTKPCAKDGRHGPGFVVITAKTARSALDAAGTNVGAEKENAILRDRLENLLIAIGMGWDLDGVVAEAQAALIVGADVGAEERPWDVTGIPSVTYGRHKE